ncbi:hypothetical protein [Nannocystis radixulma]|uniref:Uncharacterized protein n=1 Tax=Nannocystis radixulma TaxID=2995305 RepID=A0ABT5BMP4_9BACT|nr:hypothetical protein [Nannocystis radixulma]MDC0674774.1 hypothetical protein [Nannocystis radixulma]
MTDLWLVIPREVGVGAPEKFDSDVLDFINQELTDRGLRSGITSQLVLRIREAGAAKVARMLWFDAEYVFDPDGELDEGLRDDEDYLRWRSERVERARAEIADVMRMAAPGARTFDEPEVPRARRFRWTAHWLLHRAFPEVFPAPETPVLTWTMQGLRSGLEFPRTSEFAALAEMAAMSLAAGGHPFAALEQPRSWSDDLFYAESRSLGPGAPADWGAQWQRPGGPFPRVEVRVYLPTRHAWLPAGPWTASVEWMSGGDLWKALSLD